MTPVLIIPIVLFSSSAFAYVSQFYRSDGTSGMIHGVGWSREIVRQNSLRSYCDSSALV